VPWNTVHLHEVVATIRNQDLTGALVLLSSARRKSSVFAEPPDACSATSDVKSIRRPSAKSVRPVTQRPISWLGRVIRP